MVNKHVNYHPSPSGLTIRIYRFISLQTTQCFIFLQNVCCIFCISYHGFGTYSKSECSDCWKMYLCVKSLKLNTLTNATSQAKLFSRFCHHPFRQREINYPPGSVYWKIYFPPQLKGEDYEGSLKLAIGSIVGSVNRFCCCKSEELRNSFLIFCIYFQVYCKKIFRL